MYRLQGTYALLFGSWISPAPATKAVTQTWGGWIKDWVSWGPLGTSLGVAAAVSEWIVPPIAPILKGTATTIKYVGGTVSSASTFESKAFLSSLGMGVLIFFTTYN